MSATDTLLSCACSSMSRDCKVRVRSLISFSLLWICSGLGAAARDTAVLCGAKAGEKFRGSGQSVQQWGSLKWAGKSCYQFSVPAVKALTILFYYGFIIFPYFCQNLGQVFRRRRVHFHIDFEVLRWAICFHVLLVQAWETKRFVHEKGNRFHTYTCLFFSSILPECPRYSFHRGEVNW